MGIDYDTLLMFNESKWLDRDDIFIDFFFRVSSCETGFWVDKNVLMGSDSSPSIGYSFYWLKAFDLWNKE